ncbi:hypothetical protein K0M31_005183 [Melipona bicolor]|uniref:Uncharacterized protein n=1 Tax=Melipona bicolor TaxID=60889 RepID=A0AA40FV85_9HYME|nr:hypothetical protein K0M31_005183 [Melipona bicolor]
MEMLECITICKPVVGNNLLLNRAGEKVQRTRSVVNICILNAIRSSHKDLNEDKSSLLVRSCGESGLINADDRGRLSRLQRWNPSRVKI